MVLLKYRSNFWGTLEIPLIICEISLQLKWSKNYILIGCTVANQNSEFQITDTKLYIPVVTLSTHDNMKLLKQLESRFERTINWNKYLRKTIDQAQNRHSDFLIDPSFQGVNRLFILPLKDDDG